MKPTQTKFPDRRALKIQEAAHAIGVSPITIRRAIARGLITPCRAFRHLLISVEELERFLGNTPAS